MKLLLNVFTFVLQVFVLGIFVPLLITTFISIVRPETFLWLTSQDGFLVACVLGWVISLIGLSMYYSEN